MNYLRIYLKLLPVLLICSPAVGTEVAKVIEVEEVDIQLFGDLWVGWHTNTETNSTVEAPAVFSGVKSLLEKSTFNVVNFEGIMTRSFVPHTQKKFLLKMPLITAEMMIRSGINVATLANNHSMDYGSVGLIETMQRLRAAGIVVGGSGINLEESTQPIYLTTKSQTICLLPMSRALPEEFWATKTHPGTAYLDFDATAKLVESCKAKNYFTILYIHWGTELVNTPKAYQTELAHLAIDHGADAVIGHHPHIMQNIEFYRKKPIIYSLGNFAFGSVGKDRWQEGLVVRINLPDEIRKKPRFQLVPLQVQNSKVQMKPQLTFEIKDDLVAKYLPKDHICSQHSKPYVYWNCP